METRRAKAVVVLQHLLDGNQFEVEGRTYALGEDNDLKVKMTKISDGKEEEVWLGALLGGTDLPYFIQLCDKLSDDQIFIMGATGVLRSFNSRRSS